MHWIGVPSILVETGFAPNPNEFERLTEDSEQAGMTDSIAEAIGEALKVKLTAGVVI